MTRAAAAYPSPAGELPRLIASDLDGTFLSPDGTVSELNLAAIAAARDAGIGVVFATGRPPRWLDVLRGLPCDEQRVICSNGALVFDLSDDRPLISHPLPAALVAEVVAMIRERVPGVAFGVELGLRFGTEPDYVRNSADHHPEQSTVAPAEELVGAGPVIKLLVQHVAYSSDDLHAIVEPLLGDRVTVTHSSFGDLGLLEISAAGVSKASTLAEYCRGLGIDAADVAAFGDMPNDAEMLGWVGRPYVMAHAHASLAGLGAPAIGSNADSAVGRTILSWLGRE